MSPQEVEKEIQKLLKENNCGLEVLYKIKVKTLADKKENDGNN